MERIKMNWGRVSWVFFDSVLAIYLADAVSCFRFSKRLENSGTPCRNGRRRRRRIPKLRTSLHEQIHGIPVCFVRVEGFPRNAAAHLRDVLYCRFVSGVAFASVFVDVHRGRDEIEVPDGVPPRRRHTSPANSNRLLAVKLKGLLVQADNKSIHRHLVKYTHPFNIVLSNSIPSKNIYKIPFFQKYCHPFHNRVFSGCSQ